MTTTPPPPEPAAGAHRHRRRVVDVVATHNVHSKGIGDGPASAAVEKVIAAVDDRGELAAVGLQEWPRSKDKLLRGGRFASYAWRRGWRPHANGGPIGVLKSRYQVTRVYTRVLSRPCRVDKATGRRRLMGWSIAVVVEAHDTTTGELVAFVNYHLTSHVQSGGDYRHDQPLRVRRHRREVASLERLRGRLEAHGVEVVYMLGDSNFDGLRLRGLVSAWYGRENQRRGSHGRRKIDDVFGPDEADQVELVHTPSDHHAVIAVRHRPVVSS